MKRSVILILLMAASLLSAPARGAEAAETAMQPVHPLVCQTIERTLSDAVAAPAEDISDFTHVAWIMLGQHPACRSQAPNSIIANLISLAAKKDERAIMMLGEIGPPASSAVPVLEGHLREIRRRANWINTDFASYDWHRTLHEALKKITGREYTLPPIDTDSPDR